MYSDLLIDIETLATTPEATILTIGAQGFDPFSDKLTDATYYKRLILDSQPTRDINDNTVEWWSKQGEAAQEEAFGEGDDRVDIKIALEELSKLAFKHKRVWANGILFDYGILENAMRQYSVNVPWQFWNVCDARTVYKMVPGLGSAGQTNDHNALADCVNQIDMLQQAFKTLGVKSLG